jgi:hypothetical protein
MAQYLNVRQHKLGNIIIQTVHILQHDNADTGSLPVEDFVKHNPSYFQIIQPGRSTVTPLYQWRRLLPMDADRLIQFSLDSTFMAETVRVQGGAEGHWELDSEDLR